MEGIGDTANPLGQQPHISSSGNQLSRQEDIENIVPFKILDDTIDNLTITLQKLEDEMFALAKKMEFEKAAICRDKINYLKRKLIDLQALHRHEHLKACSIRLLYQHNLWLVDLLYKHHYPLNLFLSFLKFSNFL